MNKFILLMLLMVTLGLSGCSDAAGKQEAQPVQRIGSDILKTFDSVDFKRTQEFVERFENGKGDYIMAIPPIIDGGYAIYDLISDGNTVTLRIDATRDIYGGTDKKYVCSSVSMQKEQGKSKLVLGDCDGLDKDLTITPFSFEEIGS